jgi:hypothetical protein
MKQQSCRFKTPFLFEMNVFRLSEAGILALVDPIGAQSAVKVPLSRYLIFEQDDENKSFAVNLFLIP